MDELLKAATELGKLIAAQEAFHSLRKAEDEVRSDPETRKLLDQFEQQRVKIEQLETAKKPVEVTDKHEMKRLSDAVHSNEKLHNLVRAQADYMALMNRVNQTIREAIQ